MTGRVVECLVSEALYLHCLHCNGTHQKATQAACISVHKQSDTLNSLKQESCSALPELQTAKAELKRSQVAAEQHAAVLAAELAAAQSAEQLARSEASKARSAHASCSCQLAEAHKDLLEVSVCAQSVELLQTPGCGIPLPVGCASAYLAVWTASRGRAEKSTHSLTRMEPPVLHS